ncbi:hypothetical protein TNCV_1677731 [Trichonephila clavipes]|nr:hypothetical protein TNCV_1677731 [Trichonephila clavipes]
MGAASSRSRLSLHMIMIRIISTVKCFFPIVFWEFQSICQLATCDRRPHIGLGLPPHTIIAHSVKRRQSVEPVCAIASPAHLFRVNVCMSICQSMLCILSTFNGHRWSHICLGAYFWADAQCLKKCFKTTLVVPISEIK